MLCFEDERIHSWCFEWCNGNDWEECGMYTTIKDQERVIEEWKDQNREMGIKVVGNFSVEYEGYGVNSEGLWIDNGEVKINNVCF